MVAVSRLADPENILDPDDMSIPTPNLSGLRITGDNILIRPYCPPKNIQTKSGHTILLPDSVDHDRHYLQNIGQIVKLGELAYVDSGYKPGDKGYPHGWYHEKWTKEGDWVLFPRNSGQMFKYKGMRFLLMKDVYVLGVVENPIDIDVNYQTINFDKG